METKYLALQAALNLSWDQKRDYVKARQALLARNEAIRDKRRELVSRIEVTLSSFKTASAWLNLATVDDLQILSTVSQEPWRDPLYSSRHYKLHHLLSPWTLSISSGPPTNEIVGIAELCKPWYKVAYLAAVGQ